MNWYGTLQLTSLVLRVNVAETNICSPNNHQYGSRMVSKDIVSFSKP